MSRALSFGSVNIDEFYFVRDIAVPGQTVNSTRRAMLAGGKGANQAVALAKAGANAYAAGKIGTDGIWVRDGMRDMGVNVELIIVDEEMSTGRAVIQSSAKDGENAIILYGGTNRTVNETEVMAILDGSVNSSSKNTAPFGKGDWLLLQNEMSSAGYALAAAKKREMITLFNPAPMSDDVLNEYDMRLVDLCIVNETEATHMLRLLNGDDNAQASASMSPSDLVEQLFTQFSNLAGVIVTLGSEGLIAKFNDTKPSEHSNNDNNNDDDTIIRIAACPIKDKVIDTTGAGDTFIGYLVTGLMEHGWQPQHPLPHATLASVLRRASMASALAIQRQGAMESIPIRSQVDEAMNML
ncbi:Ribokinase-like protein [Syncephalis plumigaleata]|nr:Ribokinase-like protein [Syncephalis plumigaleata]